MKIFGGYGQFYDQMKLNLAISSFGGQYWSNCYYALNTADIASVAPVLAMLAGTVAGSVQTQLAKQILVALRRPGLLSWRTRTIAPIRRRVPPARSLKKALLRG